MCLCILNKVAMPPQSQIYYLKIITKEFLVRTKKSWSIPLRFSSGSQAHCDCASLPLRNSITSPDPPGFRAKSSTLSKVKSNTQPFKSSLLA